LFFVAFYATNSLMLQNITKTQKLVIAVFHKLSKWIFGSACKRFLEYPKSLKITNFISALSHRGLGASQTYFLS